VRGVETLNEGLASPGMAVSLLVYIDKFANLCDGYSFLIGREDSLPEV
jgi:hypothetical protein